MIKPRSRLKTRLTARPARPSPVIVSRTELCSRFGTADQVLNHEQHALPLAGRVKDFELELVEGVGHMPQFVAPDRVEAFIRRMADRTFASGSMLTARR